ncbi:MAG: hypothetical protein EGS78_08970, partial [Bacteroidales bacterium]|nr:hypothetical protein [Bacteroidales bacterium]
RSGVDELRNNSAAEFDKVSQVLTAQQQEFKTSLDTQREEFAQALRAEREAFVEYLRSQKDNLSAKSDEISQVVDRIRDLADTNTAMNSLLSASREQTGKLDELINIMSSRNRDGRVSSESTDFVQPKLEIPAFYKIAFGAIAGLLLLSVGISTASFFASTSSNTVIETSSLPVFKTQSVENVPDSLLIPMGANNSEKVHGAITTENKTN